MTALEDARVPFTIPEEHVAPDALRKRGLDNYGLLEDLGLLVEARLPSLPEPLRLNPVYLQYYRLKVLVDTVGLRALELAACMRALKPEEVLILEDSTSPVWDSAGEAVHLLTPDGPVYAAVAPAAAAALAIPAKVERLAGDAPPARRAPLSRAASAANALRRGLNARLSAAGAVWQLGEVAHDLPALLEILAPRFSIVRWENVLHGPLGALLSRGGGRRELDALWSALSPELARHPLLSHGGVDCAPLLLPAFKRVFVDEHARVCALTASLRALIREKRPRAALVVNTPYPENAAMLAALNAEKVPVVAVQEGGLCGYAASPMHHYCELIWADHFLAYGRGTAEHLNAARLTPRQRATAHPVGAFRLRKMKAVKPSRAASTPPTVMYVPSRFHHSLRYAPTCFGEREYFLLRRRALEALLRSGARVVYKCVPGRLAEDALAPFLAARGVETLDAPLAAALDRADAFVVDWPSTTLLELSTTDRPIRALLDAETAVPLEAALPALRRRAEVFTGRAEFAEALASPLDGGPKSDDAFLTAYGTGEWDERRLVEFFERL